MSDRCNLQIEVIGLGLDAEIPASVYAAIATVDCLVGSARHLDRFPDFTGKKLVLKDLPATLKLLQTWGQTEQKRVIAILTSGDPLLYGLGRLLLQYFPKDNLRFHPSVSSIQLAFSRLKLPWQDATVVSAHGRSLELLEAAVRQGKPHIAILTDSVNNPQVIANFVESLQLPISYQFWVCENLGSDAERIFELNNAPSTEFAALNVVVLEKAPHRPPLSSNLPLIGIPDTVFASFPDQPGLLTKKEVRILSIAELELQPNQVIWDIGAGTGSVSIEMARLIPQGQIFAIEKNTAGLSLIQQNCQRFQVQNVQIITGSAPEALIELPIPQRVFIGGSSNKLTEILTICRDRLITNRGILVGNFASPEHLHTAMTWCQQYEHTVHLLQVNLARSVPIGKVSRFAPLNPVTILKVQF